MMNTAQAAKILHLPDYYTIYDVRNAYRLAMTSGRVDRNDIQEAFVCLSNDMGAKVPAGRPDIDLDPQFAARVVNGFYCVVAEDSSAECEKRYEMDIDLDAPKNYRIARGIVQHAPYRIIFFALANIFFQIPYLMFNPDSLAYCVLGLLLVNIAFVNLMFPFVTRPLRRFLIDLVDSVFANRESGSTELIRVR